MWRAGARTANFETAERLPADVFEEALEKTRGQAVGEIVALAERRDKTAVPQPRDHEAVLRRIAEIGDEDAPTLGGEMARREDEAGIERLISKHGLTEPGEFAIDGGGETLARCDTAGMKRRGPMAGFLRVEHAVDGLKKRSRREDDTRTVGHDGDPGRRIKARPASVKEAAER